MITWAISFLSRNGRTLRRSLVVLALVLAWAAWWPMAPLFTAPRSTVLLDRRGDLLGATVAADGQWRMPPGESIPERLETCLITFEDRHFRSHVGVHLPSLIRAWKQNRRAGRTVSGGSTITMQLARMALGDRPRTYWNKLTEILLALRLELRYSKDEILAMYVANAPFGGNVVGAEAAAWRWFGRPLESLGWAESATLAVLPNSPARMHPGRNREALQAKRDRLLGSLLQRGHIDSLQWSLAVEEPLPERPLPLPRSAPHLLATLQQRGHDQQRVRTTIDADLQQRLSTIVDRYGAVLRANEVHNAALLVLDVRTGEVLAYVGNLPSASDREAGQVDIIQAPRSTGSLLKPFLHAAMLQQGERMPQQLVADIPTRYEGFMPENYDRTHAGAVPADVALARSLNVPAVRALRSHGVHRFLLTLRAMGFTHIDRSADHYGLSLVVGGAESSLWELTGAYASMARLLQYAGEEGACVHPPVVVQGKAEGCAAGQPPIQVGAIHHTLEALRTLNRPETESGWEHFGGRQDIAWKTGTSFGHRDAWAIGCTPRYAVGVWTGNASGEGRPGLTGTLAAAPLLFDVFNALPSTNTFEVPFDHLVRMATCRASGHRAGADCPQVDTLWTIPAAERTPNCPYHIPILVDPTGNLRVAPGPDAVRTTWFVLPPAMEAYYAPAHAGYRSLPPWRSGDAPGISLSSMEVIYPEPGARIVVPRGLDGERGAVVLHATHRTNGMAIHWDLDGSYHGTTTGDHRLATDLAPGQHRLTLTDTDGERTSVTFQVMHAAEAR